MKSKRISKAERKMLDHFHEQRKAKLRKKYPEIRGKQIDYVTHSYEDGWLYVNLYFTDGTSFSMDFTVNEPSIIPRAIEYGHMRDGDYHNIRTYFFKGED